MKIFIKSLSVFSIILFLSCGSLKPVTSSLNWPSNPTGRFVNNEGLSSFVISKGGGKINFSKFEYISYGKIKIDNISYKSNDIKSVYVNEKESYETINTHLARKLAHGKLSVFLRGYTSQTGSNTYTSYKWYYKKESEQDYKELKDLSYIIPVLNECPKAFDKITQSGLSPSRGSSTEEKIIIFEIVDFYNKNCK